jgi:hypothetical protein
MLEMTKVRKGILKALEKEEDGMTIHNLIIDTGFSRGAIKMNLLYLMLDKRVREINYSKVTKVYKIIN